MDFEQVYRSDPDPWSYETSPYEHEKYKQTLRACGPGPFRHAIELGGSIGVFTAMLAERCIRLSSIDSAPTALALARRRLGGHYGVELINASLPRGLDGLRAADLVVASEILYYLDDPDLEATLEAVHDRLVVGGRLVAVHWRPPGPERPHDADQIHARLHKCEWLQARSSAHTEQYLLDVLDRIDG